MCFNMASKIVEKEIIMVVRFSNFVQSRKMAVKSIGAKYITIKPLNLSEGFHRVAEYFEPNLGH